MKPICITLDDENGEETTHRLPSKWAICARCAGNGVHDHPAFANGLTHEDFAEDDPDFRGNYMAGRYDVRCDECTGSGKVLVIAEDQITEEQKRVVERYHEAQADADIERRADAYTRMMENGGAR